LGDETKTSRKKDWKERYRGDPVKQTQTNRYWVWGSALGGVIRQSKKKLRSIGWSKGVGDRSGDNVS